MLNSNIPSFKCLVRLSHFTKDEKDNDVYHDAYAFGIQSIEGKILTLKEPLNDIPAHFKQLWDCFSENVTVTNYKYLNNKRCQVMVKDKTLVWCTYMFTIDWYDNPYSNEPSDYKCGHILVSDDGYLLCQPNNRTYWKDSNWVTKEFPIEKSKIKVDNTIISVESYGDKWITDDGNSFYYDINLKLKNND